MVEETMVDMSHGYMPLDEDSLTPIRYSDSLSSMRRNRNDDVMLSPTASQNIYLEEDKLAPPSMGLPENDERDESMDPLLLHSSPSPSLNGLNYLNGVTFLVHLFVSWGIGAWGLDGIIYTRWEISKDYETLVTPSKWSYYVWIPILVFEAIFAMAQFLPEYRSQPMIQSGTGYFFFYTCVVQTAWTFCFAFRQLVISFVTVLVATISLGCLLVSQHYSTTRGQREQTQHFNKTEYWLFRFPFSLHFGWMVVMTAVHFSLLCRYLASSLSTQLAADICSLASMVCVALFFLSNFKYSRTPDFVVPIVIIWAHIGIACRLRHASDTLLEDFGQVAVDAVEEASWFFASIMSCLLAPRVLVWVCRTFFTINVVQLEDSSFGADTLSM